MPQNLWPKPTNVLNKLYFVIFNSKENSTPFHEVIYIVHVTQKHQLMIRRLLPYPISETSFDNANLRIR